MSASHQFSLLGQRRFAPFFVTQFLGAANDNIFKYAFTLLVTFQASRLSTLDPALAANLIAGVFIAPFLFFSATSGQIADKFDKARVMQSVKAFEVAIVALGAWGLAHHNFAILLTCTFLMGLHSTMFGPVKFSYLPQVLNPDEIVGGNGLVEMGTFVAILIGTMAAGVLIESFAQGPMIVAGVCLGMALAGWAASLWIPSTEPADPSLVLRLNPVAMTWRSIQVARQDRAVFLSLLGISWLWFFGAVFLTQFPLYAKEVLGGAATVANVLLAVFTVGVALGALGCERLSRRKVEIGLVPLGSIGMSIFTVDLYFASSGLPLMLDQPAMAFMVQSVHWRVLIDLFLLAVSSGLYSVPLYALIQTRSQPTHRARIIAANNILNAVFLVLAAGFGILILKVLGWRMIDLFLATAALNLMVAIYIYGLVPEFLLRFLSWVLVNSIYRVRTQDIERIPAHGPAVIVANHVSFVDALVLMAASPRPIRFVMDSAIFRIPVLSWLFHQVKAIPITSAKKDAQLMEHAFDGISQALRRGQLVCIFPEGRITDTGDLYPFKPGITRILERDPVPVIPVALQGLWGSFFSRKGGAAMSRPFRRGIWSPIGIAVGEAVTAQEALPDQLRERVSSLRADWK